MPHIIPIRDLKDTSKLSALCTETDEPIFVTKNGYGDMVIMSMKVYEKNMLMQDVYAKLAEGERDVQEGKVSDARQALKAVREKHGV